MTDTPRGLLALRNRGADHEDHEKKYRLSVVLGASVWRRALGATSVADRAVTWERKKKHSATKHGGSPTASHIKASQSHFPRFHAAFSEFLLCGFQIPLGQTLVFMG